MSGQLTKSRADGSLGVGARLRTDHPINKNPCMIESTIRIGRKAMTLGGDSSKAAIARSSAIQVWIDRIRITHVVDL